MNRCMVVSFHCNGFVHSAEKLNVFVCVFCNVVLR